MLTDHGSVCVLITFGSLLLLLLLLDVTVVRVTATAARFLHRLCWMLNQMHTAYFRRATRAGDLQRLVTRTEIADTLVVISTSWCAT
jgi:hypothetical protein